MTASAKRLQFAQDERIPVAMVRVHMIGDCRNGGNPAGFTHPAQREIPQLKPSAPTPSFKLIPLPPWSCLHIKAPGLRKSRANFFARLTAFDAPSLVETQEFESSPYVRESRSFRDSRVEPIACSFASYGKFVENANQAVAPTSSCRYFGGTFATTMRPSIDSKTRSRSCPEAP